MPVISAQSEVYLGEERDLIRKVARFVDVQADRLLRFAPEVPKVKASLL